MSEAFARSAALLGDAAMARLGAARALVVGVGGVGGWCAEALVRTGLGHITLMDDDLVAESNINRQCPATARTVGRRKVEALAERLREISPTAEVTDLCERYTADGAAAGRLAGCDVVIDAIDSVDCKARLILDAFAVGVPVISSMGAALRTDPTKVTVSRFDKVAGDGLARALRQRSRRLGEFPGRFMCVHSTEVPQMCAERGSVMPVTATFGMVLASEALKVLLAERIA